MGKSLREKLLILVTAAYIDYSMAAFTTLYFLRNVQMTPISYGVSFWRAFPG
jgi:hypothetical protein